MFWFSDERSNEQMKFKKSKGSDNVLKKAKGLSKDLEGQWPVLDSALTSINRPADLLPFTDWIAAAEPKTLSTDTITKVLGALLASQKPLPQFWIDAAQKKAEEKPIIYIYLQSFKSLTPTQNINIDSEKLVSALQTLKKPDMAQILAIIETLDKDSEIINNPSLTYEKHSVLTTDNNYVMPTEELNTLLDTGLEKKQIGITLLALLNGLAAETDNMYSEMVTKAMHSMLSIGLIEDAKLVGTESITDVLNKY